MPRILVTGVSSGIGKACAEHFARQGWDVVGTVRDPARMAEEPWPGPGSVSLEALDLSRAGAGAELGERVIERYGCPDVLLNNAGMLQFGSVEDTDPVLIEQLFRVNVFEQIGLAMALVPAMRERGSGTIANVTSLGGRLTFPFFATYNATKHALEGFSEGLWHELQPFGIRVKVIEPGFVETAIWGKVLPEDPSLLEASAPYRDYQIAMVGFEASITNRTSPADSAVEIWDAVTEQSDRLRYPVAAYARPILRARRLLGELRVMRFFHQRWMGK